MRRFEGTSEERSGLNQPTNPSCLYQPPAHYLPSTYCMLRSNIYRSTFWVNRGDFTSTIYQWYRSLYTTEVYIPQDLAAHLGDSLLNSSTNQTTRFMTDSRIYAIRNTGRYPGAVCLACATKKTKQGGQGFEPPKSVRLDVLFLKLIFFSNLYCNTVLL